MTKQPIDPSAVQKFWGIEEEDPVIAKATFEKNQAAFFGVHAEGQANEEGCGKQTKADAIRAFFAVNDKDSRKYMANKNLNSQTRRSIAWIWWYEQENSS